STFLEEEEENVEFSRHETIVICVHTGREGGSHLLLGRTALSFHFDISLCIMATCSVSPVSKIQASNLSTATAQKEEKTETLRLCLRYVYLRIFFLSCP